PSIALLNGYGPTECADNVTHFPITRPLPATSIHTPIGHPIGNMRLYILDRRLNPVPIGVRGELFIGGIGVGRGYAHDPALTAGAFLPDPFSQQPGARLYKTGDLARYLPTGMFEFLGRLDHQVKIRGYRIELGEIDVVLSQHPAVLQVVARVQEEPSGEKRLLAYVVLQPAFNVTSDELRQYMQKRLPGYLIPSLFVLLSALPLMPNGKINYRALPVPGQSPADKTALFVAPHTYAEEILAGIWTDVLRVKQAGIHDNFFELGGDSILSLQVIVRARQAGLHFTPKQLFQHQTIAALAEVAETSLIARAEQGIVSGPVPLTPIQKWLFEQELSEPQHFTQAILLSTPPDLDVPLLERATEHVQRHHDALRMRFKRHATGWQQINLRDDILEPVTRVDLSACAPGEQKTAIEATIARLQGSLNLAEGPLLRLAFFDLGQQPGRLVLLIHHLVVDAVSWRIIMTDLQLAYQQLKAGEALRLPPKTTSFQQWARHLHEYARSTNLQQELAYWLAGSQAQTQPLPLDRADSSPIEAFTRSIVVTLSRAETHALLREVPPVYHTQMNDLLLTALARACAQWTGSRRVLVDLEAHGREEILEGLDVSRTVGWFTALYPVVLDLETSNTAGEAIITIKEQLRRIPGRGIGYGILRYLKEDPAIIEQLRSFPRAEIRFNYFGQFEQIASDTSLFGGASESTGPAISSREKRGYLLDINGFTAGDQLHMRWTYSSQVYEPATIERLASRFLEELQILIAHSKSPEAGGYTPSDFPQARLNQRALDKLIARVSQDKRR
ncbi:MAG TPA: condensation domain-containing protein, partial [Ktedonobacteraceae bacterium]